MTGPVGNPPDGLLGRWARPSTPEPGLLESEGPARACEVSLGDALGDGLGLAGAGAAAPAA
jgi:hypothetical protein